MSRVTTGRATPPRIDLGSARPPDLLVVRPDLVLRRWRTGDAGALADLVRTARDHLRPWLPWVASYDDDAAAAAATFLAQRDPAWDDALAFAYAMTTPGEDEAIVGSVGLENRIGDGGLEIGYWLVPAATGRGLMTSAVAALADAALALEPVARLEIHHDVANLRSGAVPARLGWQRVRERTRPLEAPAETGRTVVWEIRRPGDRSSRTEPDLTGAGGPTRG